LPADKFLLAGKIYIFSIVYLTGSGSNRQPLSQTRSSPVSFHGHASSHVPAFSEASHIPDSLVNLTILPV
ncbi:hypothetical protein, partial [Ruminococcus sp. 1001275B_160808_F8]